MGIQNDFKIFLYSFLVKYLELAQVVDRANMKQSS